MEASGCSTLGTDVESGARSGLPEQSDRQLHRNFTTTRHGDPHSGAPQLVHAIRARVALMNNGERKGGSPEYWQTVHEAPGLEDFCKYIARRQAARSTIPEQFLANINETDHGHDIKMSVRPDGSFAMTNERTGFTKEYPVRNGVSR